MKVVIDAGHGGHDPGTVAHDGTKEKDIVFGYAKELKKLLDENHATLMTRVNDDFVGLALRAHRANDWDADCFISLHANASLNPSANGAWIIHDDDTVFGISLAQYIWRAMAHIPGVMDADPEEEIYADNTPWVNNRELTVVSDTNMPAVLIELGFLTNKDDLADLKKPEIREQICKAIVNGIEKWGVQRGLYIEAPEIELVGEKDSLYVNPTIRPVRPWLRSAVAVAQEEAFVGETAGSLALRTIHGMVDSPEAKEALNSVKRTLIALALSWLDKVLRDALGVGGTT